MTKTIALGAFGLTWLLLLAGCVTETVGGSEVKQDPQAALEKRVELAPAIYWAEGTGRMRNAIWRSPTILIQKSGGTRGLWFGLSEHRRIRPRGG